jgi:hypothetical protein
LWRSAVIYAVRGITRGRDRWTKIRQWFALMLNSRGNRPSLNPAGSILSNLARDIRLEADER